jgi:hypothetical protein
MPARVFFGVCVVAVIFLLYVLISLFRDSKRKRKRAPFVR